MIELMPIGFTIITGMHKLENNQTKHITSSHVQYEQEIEINKRDYPHMPKFVFIFTTINHLSQGTYSSQPKISKYKKQTSFKLLIWTSLLCLDSL